MSAWSLVGKHPEWYSLVMWYLPVFNTLRNLHADFHSCYIISCPSTRYGVSPTLVLVYFFFFYTGFSLYDPDWPGTDNIDQADLKFRELCLLLPPSWVLRVSHAPPEAQRGSLFYCQLFHLFLRQVLVHARLTSYCSVAKDDADPPTSSSWILWLQAWVPYYSLS